MGDDAPRAGNASAAARAPWRDTALRGDRRGRLRLIGEAVALSRRFAWVAWLGVAFFVLGDTVVEDGRQRMDTAISRFAHSHIHPPLTRLMLWGTDLASAPVVVPLMLAACGLLAVRRRRAEAALVAASWLGGLALHVTLKLFYQRPRPSLFPSLAPDGGYSFPSGHTVTAVMTFGLLTLLIGRSRSQRMRRGLGLAGALGVVWVATSRVYLGAHYATDVLGSVLIAGAWLRVSVVAIPRLVPNRAPEAPRPHA